MKKSEPRARMSASDEEELRSHFRQTLAALFLLFLLVGTVSYFFEDQIKGAAEFIFERFGILGMTLFIGVNDLIVSPIPPDLALVVLSHSPESARWYLWVFVFGLASSAAGMGGWLLGRKLRGTRLPQWIFGKKLEAGEELMKKFGLISVALGALTPLPYSLTTWTAGLLNTPFRYVAIASLLRIPRFALYYLILNGALSFGGRSLFS